MKRVYITIIIFLFTSLTSFGLSTDPIVLSKALEEAGGPTVTITLNAGQISPTGTSPIVFKATFNEAVAGFTTGDVTTSASTVTGTLTATVAQIAPNDGTTYSITVTGMTGSGNVVVTIAADVCAATAPPAKQNQPSVNINNTVAYDNVFPSAFTVGSVITTGGTIVAGRWNASNTGVDVTVPIENDASLTGGTVQLQARISSGAFANIGSAIPILIGDLNGNITTSLTDTQFQAITGFANGTTIQVRAIITDLAGNATTGANSLTTIIVDEALPGGFTVGAVVTTGGTVKAGYWNSTNTGVNVTVPIANDASLNGGTLQLQARISSGVFADIGTSSAIASVNTNKVVSLTDVEFEAIAGFADGETVEVRAIITDIAGNSTTGNASATTILVDQTAPSAFVVGAVVTTGGTVVAGFWNSTNTGLSVDVPIANDATLTGGTVQLQARVSTGSFANVGAAATILIGDLNGNKTVTITKAQLEAIASFAENAVVEVRAVINDIASNSTTGTTSATTLTVDRVGPPLTLTQPAASTFVNTARVTYTLGGTVLSSGTITWTRTAGTADGSSPHTQALVGAELTTNQSNYTLTNNPTLVNGAVYTVAFSSSDAAGNTTTVSNTVVNFDTSAPSAPSTVAVTTTGGNVVASYWNGSNTGVNLAINIPNDLSLVNGVVQIEASSNGAIWNPITSSSSTTISSVNTTKNMTITAANILAISGYAQSVSLRFRARLVDQAGNGPSAFTIGTPLLFVDTVKPTITLATFFANLTAPAGNDPLFTDCNGTTRDKASSREFIHLTMSEPMGPANGTIPTVGTPGFAASTGAFDVTCTDRGATVFHPTNVIHLHAEFLSTSPDVDGAWDGNTTFSFTAGGTNVRDVAGNEMASVVTISPGDPSPPVLATGMVLFPNGNGPETIVFQFDETLNGAVTNNVTGFTTSFGLINTLLNNYNSGTRTVTLTSLADGMWTDAVTVSYDQLTGNVTDPANNEMVAFGGLSPNPAEPIFLQGVSITSNNTTNAVYATTGNTITLDFTAARALSGTPIVTIGGLSANVSLIGGLTYSATLVTTAAVPTGPIAFQIDVTEALTTTTVTATTDGSGVTFDKTAPTINPVSISSNNIDPAYSKPGDIITLSFSVDEVLSATPTVTIGGFAVNPGNISNVGLNYTATLALNNTYTEGILAFSINVLDVAGNATNRTTTSNASAVTFDKTNPTVTSIVVNNSIINSYAASINGTTPTLNGNQIDYTINFSEPVSNVTFTTLDEIDSGPSPGYPRVNTNQLSVSPVTAGGAPSTSPSQYWKVIYNNVSGTGTYRLDLVNNLTVRDRASLALSVPGGIFIGPSYTVSMPQPTNPVSALSTNNINATDITVNWTDVGTASHYLVILTTAGSAPAVTDGTYVINDNNFGDGTVAQNIVQGVQKATFTGLTANTAYNVFIYPYALSPNTIAVNNTAIDFNPTTPAILSRASDIIQDGTFVYSQNIDYASNQTTDIPTGTGANSVVLERFVLRDGAGSPDSDNFGTTLTSLTLDVVNYQNLRKLALYDGTTEIQELSVTSPTITVINATTARITFSGVSLSTAADNGNKTLSLRASFNSTGVTDNQIISFSVVSATASGTSSSQLKTNTPAGIQSNLPSGTNNINNKIEVVATQIDFTTVPVSASISVPFVVQVSARDLFANLDLDYNGTISTTETNPSSDLLFHTLNNPSGAFVNGQLTYPASFQFDIGDGNVQLTINSGAGSGANNVNAGAIAGTSPVISVISSYESLIVSSDFYNGSSRDINYINYQDANITSAANGFELDFLYLADGGYDLFDADGAPTILDDLTLGISNPQSIKKIAIYEKDLNTNAMTEVQELDNSNITVTNGYGQITFNNLNISSPDDFYKGVIILATFNSSTATIQDRDTIQVSVLAATLNAGSKFAPNAAQTNSIAGEPINNVTFPPAATALQRGTYSPYNKLQVIATSLDFVTQPSIIAGSNEPIDGSAGASPGGSTGIVHARDKFAVIDTDFTGAASATSVSADANPFGYPASFTNGVLDLTGMQYANAGDGTLIVKAGVLDSSVPGVGDIGNSIACSTVDVIHVTAQNDLTNGVEVSESLKGGTTSKRIFGVDFFAEHATASEPSLTGFSIIFRDDVGDPYPYTSASGTVFKNFKLFMAEGNSSPIPLAEGVDYTLDPLETQTAALISSGAPSTSKDKLAFILTNPVTLYQSNYKFYLNVDIDVNVSVGTKPITPYLIDLGYGFINTNDNIKTTVGSSTAQVQGITRKFASVKPPVLVYTSPSNGQLNVDPALNVIKLKFDVPVVTFDGVIKVYNRETGTLRATFMASNGLSDGSNLKAAAVDTLEFVAPVGFDFKKDTVYYVTIEKGVFSNIDVNQRRGISDEGFNLYGGIEYNGTFYFKGSSPNPPQLIGTDATKYYYSPTSATFNFQFNQFGKVHYMVVHPTSPGVAPLKVTNAQILGTDPYTNSTIIARGTTVIDQQAPNLQYVTINANLINNIDYYVYAYAENDANPIPIVTSAPYGSSTNAFAVDADGPTLKIKKTSTTTNLVNNPRFEVCSNSSVKMEEPIIISEPLGNAGDFATGFGITDIQSFNILLPTGFQFDVTKTPTINFNGADFKPLPTDTKAPEDTVSALFINTTILKVSFINNGSTSFDNIIISNLYIIASSSDINGNITRFSGSGLTTITDGRVLARISAGSSGAISFNNSYNKAFDLPWPYPQITKTVTYIPDNFATTVKLIPVPPQGDYGASFFSGSGLTNDVLTLAAVTKDAAFNITLTHTDQNGCNSTTVEQYLVYDHTKTIPELLKTTVTGYNISGTKVGLKPGPVNSDNILGTSDDYVPGLPTTTLNQVDSVSYVGLAGYQLIDLYANIPVRTSGSGQVLDESSPTWQSLVSNIPRLAVVDKNNNGGLHDFTSTLGQIFKTYNWEYSDLINKNLTGSLYPYDSITSRFAERVKSAGTANGKLFFNAGSLGIIEFTGVYQSTADFSVFVPFRQEVELFIPAVPVVEVLGESDKLGRTPIFCENGSPFTITGYPLATSSDVTGFFTLKDSVSGVSINDPGFVDNGNGTASFSPSSLVLKNLYKTIKVEYTYQQNNSPAVATGVLYIRVTPNPVANFTTSMRCEDIDISFTDTSILALAADVFIEQAIWSYADNKALARENGDTILYPSTRIPIHRYSDPGSYPNVSLSVKTNFGCANVSPAIKTLSIGGTPAVAFSFNGVSTADPITFTNQSTIVNDVTNQLDWTFGDGNTQTITSNFGSPVINNYTTAGAYTANLKVTSLIGCNANLSKSVIVLPRVVSTIAVPYLATFETDNGGWQHAPTDTVDNISDSWAHGAVNKTLTKSTIDGTKAWATSLTGTFNANERSALYSPSFDISGLTRPMISFDKFVQFNRNEGVIIQYSVDNKNVADETKEWYVLGEDIDEGVEWFNGQSIASKPGDQPINDFGWNDSNITEWREAKHTISDVSPKPPVAGATRVVFRFALAARQSDLPITVDNEGFALDNFRVGERTRIILHEYFTNTGNSSADELIETNVIRNFKTVGTDVIRINYHTAFPGADPFNLDNPADNSSRALFYNVNSTPDSYLDGKYGGGQLLKEKFSLWGEKSFNKQTLSLANSKIVINKTIDADGLKINVDVTAIETTIPKDSVALFIAILEESIPFSSLSSSQKEKVLSGETVFDYVLKKMLPSAAGTVLSADIPNGTTKTFGLLANSNQDDTFIWKPDPSKFYSPSTGDLAIVAFLQNVVTRKIYQSAIVTDLNDPVINVVTGIEAILPEQVNVYPNPASKEFRVELPAFVQNEVPMNLIDLTGRKHDGGVIRSGSNEATVNVENLSEGIYILEIGAGSTGIIRKKIMVVMKN